MSAAIDTNVLVRVLVQDPTAAAQCAAAKTCGRRGLRQRRAAPHHAVRAAGNCLLVARATHLGRDRFLAFDADAAKLPRAELVS